MARAGHAELRTGCATDSAKRGGTDPDCCCEDGKIHGGQGVQGCGQRQEVVDHLSHNSTSSGIYRDTLYAPPRNPPRLNVASSLVGKMRAPHTPVMAGCDASAEEVTALRVAFVGCLFPGRARHSVVRYCAHGAQNRR